VYVEIHDVEAFIPRPASPGDVRIGPSWEEGTPAEGFHISDLNNDGNRDIALWFFIPTLVANGHLSLETTELTVWGRDASTGQNYRGIAQVTVVPRDPPPPLGHITGRVINEATGAPVAGALVDLIGQPHHATTGADGRFTIMHVFVGTHDLVITHPDFVGRGIRGVVVAADETTDIGDVAIIPQQVGWNTTAQAFRGQNGQRYTYFCPAGGSYFTVWGTDVYTDDSAVCVAAVHVGLITYASGGHVTFEIRPGQDSYVGSLRNGVQTHNWGSWPGSFVFPYANP
jgi:hypothetical protein